MTTDLDSPESVTIPKQILDFLEESGPATPKEISDQTGNNHNSVRSAIGRLKSDGKISKLPEWQREKEGEYDLESRVQDMPPGVEQELDVVKGKENSYNDSSISYRLTQAGAGPGRTSSNQRMTVDKKLMRSELGRVPDKDEGFWVQIQGHSMEPWLADGQYVFALDQQVVDVPGRYVIWWGGHESEVCCYLAKLSEKTLLLRKYGPEKEFQLTHVEGDTYEIEDGTTVRLRVRGRIIWPPDRARSVMETVTDQIGQVMKEALSDL